MQVFKAAALLSAFLLSACELLPLATECTQDVWPAIVVEVRDSMSSAHIAAGATGIVRDGNFAERLQIIGWRGSPPNDTATTLGGVYERSGRYEVVVTHPGYREWRQMGVRVTEDACHVRTARLTALLVRQ